jgi:hypothetical protein
MLKWFKPKTLQETLDSGLKEVKVEGVIFHVRKVIPDDYLAGCQVMLEAYGIYNRDHKKKDKTVDPKLFEKIRSHYRDVIMSGVVKPELTRKKDPGKAVFVDDVLDNWNMATGVYDAIMLHTHGKKKLLQSGYLGRSF